MIQQPLAIRWGIIGAVFLVWIGLSYSTLSSGGATWSDSKPAGVLQVSFLDVGQGDAIFIETPDNVQVLIDGGPDGTVVRRLSEYMSWYDRTIDMVVATHPDKDHIAGLIDVLARYNITTIITTEQTGDTMVASSYQSALQQEGAQLQFARAGQTYQVGASTTLRVFSPAGNPAMLESNASSIVVQVLYGDTAFFLTGDAPIGVEEYIAYTYGDMIGSDVLKLGHHGSRTSTSPVFVDVVAPTYAVVSAAADNRYGHPHPEVLDIAEAAGARILTTADNGTITFYSDGTEVWLAR